MVWVIACKTCPCAHMVIQAVCSPTSTQYVTIVIHRVLPAMLPEVYNLLWARNYSKQNVQVVRDEVIFNLLYFLFDILFFKLTSSASTSWRAKVPYLQPSLNHASYPEWIWSLPGMALWQESVVGVINLRTESRVGTNLLPLANTLIHTRWIAWVWELRHAMHCSGPYSASKKHHQQLFQVKLGSAHTVAHKTVPMFCCFGQKCLVWDDDIIKGPETYVKQTRPSWLYITFNITWFWQKPME